MIGTMTNQMVIGKMVTNGTRKKFARAEDVQLIIVAFAANRFVICALNVVRVFAQNHIQKNKLETTKNDCIRSF